MILRGYRDENSPNRIRKMSSSIPLFINIYNSIYKVATLNWWDQYWTKEQDGKRFKKKKILKRKKKNKEKIC
jgi:hypothetical protein